MVIVSTLVLGLLIFWFFVEFAVGHFRSWNTRQQRTRLDDDEMDDALLAAWRTGDRGTGQQLLERHYERVHRFFANKVTEPQDLTQRTFLACIESVHRYREGRSFRAYLLGIAYNVLRHHFRQLRGSRNALPLETTSIRDMGQTPSEVLAVHDQKSLVRMALQHLPLERQTVLELHMWEELTTQEIADVLGWPLGTVKDRIRRAKLELHERIEAHTKGARPR